MMNPSDSRHAIQQALAAFDGQPLRDSAIPFFNTLGYASDRQIALPSEPDTFLATYDREQRLNHEKALADEWQTVDLLFQLTEADVAGQVALFSATGETIDNSIIESYLFAAVDLRGDAYTRSQLAQITREINKLFPMPVMVLFRANGLLTLAVIHRRLHKRDASRDVLEKVTLIRDIRTAHPHRAHVEILHDLSLPVLSGDHGFTNFVELHNAWQRALDSSELNKRFFREIADWYFWAVGEVTFPDGAGPDETRNATSVIRLITRLIFVWFLKEKGLVPDALFSKRRLDGLLRWDDPQGSTYYKAILQNLFFATLNQEMGAGRRFRGKGAGGDTGRSRDRHYAIHNVYRYEDAFTDSACALALFATVPFLNGGLFECLDRRTDDGIIRIDGFSDRKDNPLRVPDELFFGGERTVDLNDTYDTRGRTYKVQGLINILNRYKFTIDENTPIEEDVALDPELLGKVFENLLAAYNPETGTTARRATGSFYTPREIVNYMVDEALLAYLASVDLTGFENLSGLGESDLDNDARLRTLLAYNDEPHGFSDAEVAQLIAAIDRVNILDPACGSGAFPMGILHKLVFVLGKLDPGNERWKARQLAKAAEIDDPDIRRRTMADIEVTFARNGLDYGRKLYLIENCIFGVDIQPIAVQIAKLRFFISLVVDQQIDEGAPNRGVLPLPNLETKFVAANTLLGIERPKDEHSGLAMGLRSGEVVRMERELKEVRHRHFTARSPETKLKYRQRDAELRAAIADELQRTGLAGEAVEQLAQWNPYDQNAHAEFFDAEWMFGLGEGFDIVIGNPPYVRQERIRDLKPALQLRYRCYTGTADLYVYFFEAGYTLLRPGGVLVYISSNKYFRSGYGKKLRALLGQQTTIRQLIDFGDAPVFTAIAYPSIISLRKAAPGESRVRVLNWEPGPPIERFVEVWREQRFEMPQTALGADGWRLEGADALALLAKLRRAGVPLGEYVGGRFYRGILTGLNEAFVVDRATRDRLIAADPRSAEVLKPFLRGRDVKRWRVEPQDLWLIFTRRGILIDNYPAIKSHLHNYKERLMPKPAGWVGSWSGRKAGSYEWYEIQDSIAYWEEFERPKIVIPAIAERTAYAADQQGYFSNDKTSICVTVDYLYLTGILNSLLMWWLIRQSAASRQGGFYEFKPMYVTKLPVAATKNAAPIEKLVNRILLEKEEDGNLDVSSLENELDSLVYTLYGLTDAEIALIEGEANGRQATPPTAPDDADDGDDVPVSVHAVPPSLAPLFFTGAAPQGDFTTRKAAVERLAQDGSPQAAQDLAAALADENDTVRWLAATHLRRLGGPAVAGVVRAFLDQTDDPAARAEAQRVLDSLDGQ